MTQHTRQLLRFSGGAVCLLTLVVAGSTLAAKVVPQSSNRPPSYVPPEPLPDTGPKVDSKELPVFAGTEVFDRPDKGWGFKLNLKGFRDAASTVPSQMNLVGFGLREEKSGVTLAHLYVNSFKTPQLSSALAIADAMYANLKNNPDVDISSARRRSVGEIEIVEYRKREVWDKPITRQHLNAIYAHKGSYVDMHLSKTEFSPADSLVFRNIINSFVVVDPYNRPPSRRIKADSSWVDQRYVDSMKAVLKNPKKKP